MIDPFNTVVMARLNIAFLIPNYPSVVLLQTNCLVLVHIRLFDLFHSNP